MLMVMVVPLQCIGGSDGGDCGGAVGATDQ